MNQLIKFAIRIVIAIIIYSLFGGITLVIMIVLYVIGMACWEIYTDGPAVHYAVNMAKGILGKHAYKKSIRDQMDKEEEKEPKEERSAFDHVINKK